MIIVVGLIGQTTVHPLPLLAQKMIPPVLILLSLFTVAQKELYTLIAFEESTPMLLPLFPIVAARIVLVFDIVLCESRHNIILNTNSHNPENHENVGVLYFLVHLFVKNLLGSVRGGNPIRAIIF